MMTAPLWALWLGLGGAFLAGFSLRYWVHAQRFNRRNALGIEQFNSYTDLWSSRFVEALAGLISNLVLAVGLGFVLLIVARYLMSGE